VADELTISMSISYQSGNSPRLSWALASKKITVAGTAVGGLSVSVGTAEEVIPLGEVTAAGALIAVENLDDTNYIEIRDATGAANDVVRLNAREGAVFRFGSDVTAPYWIANTAAVRVWYMLIPL